MNYNKAMELFYNKLGEAKIMALATSKDDYVMIRNVSCLIYNERIYFKTDKNFTKTKQLLENTKVALCHHGVSFEGIATNKGLVTQDQTFIEAYKKHWQYSYNAYEHKDTEILFEIEPIKIEIWDQDENEYAFQTTIDTIKKEAEINRYD